MPITTKHLRPFARRVGVASARICSCVPAFYCKQPFLLLLLSGRGCYALSYLLCFGVLADREGRHGRARRGRDEREGRWVGHKGGQVRRGGSEGAPLQGQPVAVHDGRRGRSRKGVGNARSELGGDVQFGGRNLA